MSSAQPGFPRSSRQKQIPSSPGFRSALGSGLEEAGAENSPLAPLCCIISDTKEIGRTHEMRDEVSSTSYYKPLGIL